MFLDIWSKADACLRDISDAYKGNSGSGMFSDIWGKKDACLRDISDDYKVEKRFSRTLSGDEDFLEIESHRATWNKSIQGQKSEA